MKKVRCLLSLLMLVVSLLLPSLMVASTSTIKDDLARITAYLSQRQNLKGARLLFIQQANEGAIAKSKTKPGCYTLTLRKLKGKVLYFTDEPKRMTGRLSNRHFVKTILYNSKKYHVKPNVAIQAYVLKNNSITEMNEVAVLTNPKYNAKAQTVSYQACALPKNKLSPTKTLQNVNLFFDQVRPWPP